MTSQLQGGTYEIDTRNFEEAFPQVDFTIEPTGNKVLVQLRRTKTKTASGFYIPDSVQQIEKYNEVVALVRRLGPTAYRNLDTLEPWPEGIWVKPGDLVRVGKYGNDRFSIPFGDANDSGEVSFVMAEDVDIFGKIESWDVAKQIVPFVR